MNSFQKHTLILLTTLSLLSIQSAQAAGHENHVDHSGHDHTRPDSHAPIGVTGDHLMRKGEIMLSYRFMSMEMDGNRTDTDSVSVPLPGYMVSPLSMDMDMHMIGVMYAPSDQLTLMAMVPYTSISMDHVNIKGVNFTTESSGIGDIKLAATYGLFAKPGSDFLFNFAVNAPTGSIDERDSRSEEHTSELQSRGLISYAVFCLKKKKTTSAIQKLNH